LWRRAEEIGETECREGRIWQRVFSWLLTLFVR
jgi:hypothetical protein